MDELSMIHGFHMKNSVKEENTSFFINGRVKQENSTSPPPPPPCAASQILSFEKSCSLNHEAAVPAFYDEKIEYYATKGADSMTKNQHHGQSQDHVMAERKRREKVSERFIALTSIIPGLKKKDKTSVLGEAIEYIKQLQERVKLLEEKTATRNVESVVLVSSKSQLCSNNVESDDIPEDQIQAFLPEIEARISDNDVLIRIHFEKKLSSVVKILSQMKKFHLSVVSSSILPFGNSTIDMTVIAKKDSEFDMPIRNLVKELRRLIC